MGKRFSSMAELLQAGVPLATLALLVACGDNDAQTPAVDAGNDPGGDVVEQDTHDDTTVPTDSSELDTADVQPDLGTDADDVAPDGDADVADAPDVPGPDPGLGAWVETWIDESAAFANVDQFVGTGGFGFAYAALTPAAQRPIGFVRLGPDTTDNGFHDSLKHFSGYYYADPDVRGFSHTHFVGTGAVDYGNLRVLAVRGRPETPWSHWTEMDKASEVARPGYYAVTLPEENVQVELAAAGFSGIHRYTFGESGGAGVVTFDAAATVNDTNVQNSALMYADGEISGWIDFRGGFVGRSRGFRYHVVLQIDPIPDRVEVWGPAGYFDPDAEGSGEPDGSGTAEGSETPEPTGLVTGGSRAGFVMHYDDPGVVDVRFALSMADLDGARNNLAQEIGDRTLEAVEADARAAWAPIVSQVRIRGGWERDLRVFYTAMYNGWRMPSRWRELDGRYLGFDGEVHPDPGYGYLTDLSLWDTFRTLHPWYELVAPQVAIDTVRSLVDMGQRTGKVPRWPAGAGETGSMLGSAGVTVIAGAYLKELGGFDAQEAFDAAYNGDYGPVLEGREGRGREDIAVYDAYGYIPTDLVNESVSLTLEYAWADDSLLRMARGLGEDAEVIAHLERMAASWTRTLNPETGFFAPRRADGVFEGQRREQTIYMGGGPFTEGNAWHWRFYPLWDVPAFAAALGGEEALRAEMEEFLTRSGLGRSGPVRDVLPNPWYWHGNEPAIHTVPMMALAGDPARAAWWAREIQRRMYGDGPDGLAGNDDGGTLSAWLLFNALGLYPIAGTDQYIWMYPLFEEIEVDLPGGTLRIEAPEARGGVPSAFTITLNGTLVTAPTVSHAALVNGATIRFIATTE